MVKYADSPLVAIASKNGGSSKGRASSGATQRPAEWRPFGWASMRRRCECHTYPPNMYAADLGAAASRRRPLRSGSPPAVSRRARRKPRISLREKWGPGKGQASSGATHRPAEWGMRRRFAAAHFLMGVDADGMVDVERRRRIRTPQMRAPKLFGRGSPRLYRGWFGGSPVSPYKQMGAE